MMVSDSKLKFFFSNVNSLKNANNFSGLITETNKFSPHIIALTESWLKPYYNSNLLAISGYSLIRADRVVKKEDGSLFGGGGVAVYLHNSLNFKILHTSITDDINKPDFLILEIFINTSVLLLSIVYRRPGGTTLDGYGGVLGDFLSAKEYTHILIMGDFNYDISDNVKGLPLLEFSQDLGLLICPTDFTHSAFDGKSKLDIVLTRALANVSDWELAPAPLFAGHHPINFSYKIQKMALPPRFKTTRSFKKCSFNLLNQDLMRTVSNLDCSVLSETSIITDAFLTSCDKILNKHAPVFKNIIRKPKTFELDDHLKLQFKIRDKLYKKYLSTGDEAFLTKFREMRVELKTEVKKRKDDFIKNSLENSADSSPLW